MNEQDRISCKDCRKGRNKESWCWKALKAFEEAVTAELVAGGEVRLVGFGTFDVKERAAHEGVNPQSGEKIQIAASKAPRFKAGKALKDAVNK